MEQEDEISLSRSRSRSPSLSSLVEDLKRQFSVCSALGGRYLYDIIENRGFVVYSDDSVVVTPLVVKP